MKQTISKWCNIASLILIICFAVKVAIDYSNYTSTLNSAPFYVWVLVDAIYFVMPAVIVFIVGIVLKKMQ